MRTSLLLLLFTIAVAPASPAQQAREARYHEVLENDHIVVYELALAIGQQAPVYQNVHDIVWIALGDSAFTLVRSEGGESEWRLKGGDTRFLRRFRARLVRNDGPAPLRAVIVEIKSRGLNPESCGCESRVQRSVCGCEKSLSLPDLWALSMGSITLAGTTLTPGQGFQGARSRDDMLLIAITPLELRDEADPASPPPLRLSAGDVTWVKEGRHQFRNMSGQPARFVTLEF